MKKTADHTDLTKKYNGLGEYIELSLGEKTLTQLAKSRGENDTTYGRKLGGRMKPLVAKMVKDMQFLQEECGRLQEECGRLREERKSAQDDADVLRSQNGTLKEECKSLQEEVEKVREQESKVQEEKAKVQGDLTKSQGELKKVQGELGRWTDRPEFVNQLASERVKYFLLFVFAVFEIAEGFNVLKEKGWEIAIPASIALGVSLTIFAARENKWGKIFCIVVSIALGAIFFDLPSKDAADWLYALAPAFIVSLIAFRD